MKVTQYIGSNSTIQTLGCILWAHIIVNPKCSILETHFESNMLLKDLQARGRKGVYQGVHDVCMLLS